MGGLEEWFPVAVIRKRLIFIPFLLQVLQFLRTWMSVLWHALQNGIHAWTIPPVGGKLLAVPTGAGCSSGPVFRDETSGDEVILQNLKQSQQLPSPPHPVQPWMTRSRISVASEQKLCLATGQIMSLLVSWSLLQVFAGFHNYFRAAERRVRRKVEQRDLGLQRSQEQVFPSHQSWRKKLSLWISTGCVRIIHTCIVMCLCNRFSSVSSLKLVCWFRLSANTFSLKSLLLNSGTESELFFWDPCLRVDFALLL